jgi:hypothetical protein
MEGIYREKEKGLQSALQDTKEELYRYKYELNQPRECKEINGIYRNPTDFYTNLSTRQYICQGTLGELRGDRNQVSRLSLPYQIGCSIKVYQCFLIYCLRFCCQIHFEGLIKRKASYMSDRSNYLDPNETTPQQFTPSSSSPDNASPPGQYTVESTMAAPVIRMPMPQPGTANAPHFEGRNASSFLRRFKSLCADHGISEPGQVCERLVDYCDLRIGNWIESLTAYSGKDWQELVKEIKEEFKEQDVEHQLYTVSYLTTYVKQPREWDSSIREYIREYTGVSARLFQKGLISEREQTSMFLDGLPWPLLKKVIRKGNLDRRNLDKSFNEVRRMTAKVIDEKDREVEFREKQKSLPEVKQINKEFSKQGQEFVHSNQDAGHDNMAQQIEELTKGIEGLVLPIRAMANHGDYRNHNPSSNTIPPNQRDGGNRFGSGARVNANASNEAVCFYCQRDDCAPNWRACPEFRNDRETGYCHFGPDDGKIHVGKVSDSGPVVPLRRGESHMNSVRNAFQDWVRQAPQNTAGKINVIQASSNSIGAVLVGSRRAENHLVDEEETDENDPLEGVVNAFAVPDTAGQKRKNDNSLPNVRTRRQGFYREQDDSGDVVMDEVPRQESRQAPASGEGKKTAPVKEKTVPEKLANQLRDKDVTSPLLKRILEQKVEGVTVQDLLAGSPALHKAVFQSLPVGSLNSVVNAQGSKPPGGTRPCPPPATVNAHQIVEDPRRSLPVSTSRDPIYSMGVLRTRIVVNGRAVRSILDTGSMINLVRDDVARELGLPMRMGPALRMVVNTGEEVDCIACCEDVPIGIGDIVTHTPVFVVAGGDNTFILGRPWASEARLNTEEQDDGSCAATIYSSDRNRRLRFPVYPPGAGDARYAKDIWRNQIESLN